MIGFRGFGAVCSLICSVDWALLLIVPFMVLGLWISFGCGVVVGMGLGCPAARRLLRCEFAWQFRGLLASERVERVSFFHHTAAGRYFYPYTPLAARLVLTD